MFEIFEEEQIHKIRIIKFNTWTIPCGAIIPRESQL